MKTDYNTRYEGYKIIERPNILVFNKRYSGDLPIEVVVSDVKYIKFLLNNKIFKKVYGKDGNAFVKNLEEILNKLEDDNYKCKFHYFNAYRLMEEEVIFMLLPILDHMVNKISSDKFLMNLKDHLESDLEVIVKYSSVEDPVNNSS